MARGIIAPAERVTNLRWGIALILGFGVLVNYIDRGALSVAAKPLQNDLGLGPAQFGLLSSAFFWIYALAQVPIGVLLDRFGVTLLSRISALLWTVASMLTALAPNFGALVAAAPWDRRSTDVSGQRQSGRLLVPARRAQLRHLAFRCGSETLERRGRALHRLAARSIRLARDVLDHRLRSAWCSSPSFSSSTGTRVRTSA